MGTFIQPSPIRAVHFAKQNVTETLREVWDEEGVTYQGQIPPGVKVGDPLVVRPSERETWWLVVEGTESDLRARKFRARITLIRDQDEVEYLQGEVETALLRFVSREFPSYRVTVERDRAPQRGVTLFAVGREKPLHYGSGGEAVKGVGEPSPWGHPSRAGREAPLRQFDQGGQRGHRGRSSEVPDSGRCSLTSASSA